MSASSDERGVVVDPVTGQPAAIRFEGVHKTLGGQQVLRGLDLVIPKGRITAIIGRSGVGKSVTLKHMLGLMRPDQGRIWIGDLELTTATERQVRQQRNRFGVVFQQGALFDSMNVLDNVAFPLVEHTKMKRAAIRDKVLALLDQVGLEGGENKLPGELSGGMRKRVGLARALVRDPDFVLFDEPTSGLDPVLVAAMDKLIVDMQRARPELTSVVISHDVGAVVRIAHKIAFLYEGTIAHVGDPAYFQQSTDPLVVQFMTGSLEGPIEV